MSKTICAKCKSMKHEIVNANAPEVWYNFLCKSAPREPMVDPITGNKGYKAKNDLGLEYVTKDKYKYCRDINKGDCEFFELSGMLN